MPRVTVYVDDNLKARMDDAGKDLNWSAIAQRAFSGAIEQAEEAADMARDAFAKGFWDGTPYELAAD
jgi:hypothetical protein